MAKSRNTKPTKKEEIEEVVEEPTLEGTTDPEPEVETRAEHIDDQKQDIPFDPERDCPNLLRTMHRFYAGGHKPPYTRAADMIYMLKEDPDGMVSAAIEELKALVG